MKVRRFLGLAVCVMSLFLSSCALPNALETGGLFPHEHSYTERVITPTQTEQGYTEYTCACGDSYIADYTDALESLFFEKIEGKEEYAVTGLGTVQSLEVVIPETYNGLPVTEIGATAFHTQLNPACAKLTKIVIPVSVTAIRRGAFYECESLESVQLHDGITVIEEGAFCGCTTLSEIKLPSGITGIADSAFAHCGNLTEITIPKSVTFIGLWAFLHCGIKSVYFEEYTAWRAYSRVGSFREEVSAEQLQNPAFSATFLSESNKTGVFYKEGYYPAQS